MILYNSINLEGTVSLCYSSNVIPNQCKTGYISIISVRLKYLIQKVRCLIGAEVLPKVGCNRQRLHHHDLVQCHPKIPYYLGSIFDHPPWGILDTPGTL